MNKLGWVAIIAVAIAVIVTIVSIVTRGFEAVKIIDIAVLIALGTVVFIVNKRGRSE